MMKKNKYKFIKNQKKKKKKKKKNINTKKMRVYFLKLR